MNHLIGLVRGRYTVRLIFRLLLIPFVFTGALAQDKKGISSPDSYQKVRQLFLNPPSEFRSAPLWVWNDRITKRQIDEQLADFRARGIGGVFIHPRPGLITEYLS
ncbi:MAG TPA: hypothetical protein DEP53_07225, partial [Bacteroidetes bacterium]|nr:hypothetical protein [Bacteroidota bacterium]